MFGAVPITLPSWTTLQDPLRQRHHRRIYGPPSSTRFHPRAQYLQSKSCCSVSRRPENPPWLRHCSRNHCQMRSKLRAAQILPSAMTSLMFATRQTKVCAALYTWSIFSQRPHIDTLARLSVYTVPSANPAYMSLLPHFIPPKSALPHTLVMIVLDWTRPWTFIDDLQVWLEWVETWAKGDTSREVEIAREENRERCG